MGSGLFISVIATPRDSMFSAVASQDFYLIHRLVTTGFANRQAAQAARILFRYDIEGEAGLLYVQSKAPPDWSKIDPNLKLEVVGPKPLVIPSSDRLRFRLLVKPSWRVGKKESPNRGRRVTFSKEANQRLWLARKGMECGFVVESCDLWERVWFDSKTKETLPNGSPKPIYGIQFDGILHVTDRAKLVQAVAHGIGPQKAFGFGLLSLAEAG